MTDPGGGHGWRTAQHLPRKRAGGLSLGRLAERGAPDEQPLCGLLLPHPLEALEHRERLDDLLTGPGVVAVDPARISYRALSRLPEALHAGVAAGHARRLRLPRAAPARRGRRPGAPARPARRAARRRPVRRPAVPAGPLPALRPPRRRAVA